MGILAVILFSLDIIHHHDYEALSCIHDIGRRRQARRSALYNTRIHNFFLDDVEFDKIIGTERTENNGDVDNRVCFGAGITTFDIVHGTFDRDDVCLF
jgi:hypothetical protein